MKIDILSDLHIDAYFPNKIKADAVKSIYNPIILNNNIKEPSEVLIIAGDIGENNKHIIEFLKVLKDCYYKYIICVLGNHDYYLSSKDYKLAFEDNSFNRVNRLRDKINSIENVYCLNGNIMEIGGIKFGGCDSWYDGSYVSKYWKESIPDTSTWKSSMNGDFKGIKGIDSYIDLFNIEREKMEAIYKDCDVMITHVNPSNLNRHLSATYQGQKSNAFFCFDGHRYLREGNMKYWIFGHTHDVIEYEYENVKCICNPLGYPNESINGDWTWIKTIEI